MLVIGAGPAGLACGIGAARYEKTVVLEKNSRPGVKLRLAGSGQCNLTHGGPIDAFLKRYGDSKKGRFVKPAMFSFTNADTVRFFEERGVPLFERPEDGKVFPESLQSADVLRALVNELNRNGGQLRTGINIRNIKRIADGFVVETDSETFVTERLAIATGGITYPTTGSTGDGFRIAEQLGHPIVSPKPALTPVYVADYPFADSAGISLKKAPIDVYRSGKRVAQGNGDVLFTHRGLSGPGILDLSRTIEPGDTLRISLCTPFDIEPLLHGRKLLRNAISPLGVPERLLLQLFATLDIPLDLPTSETDRKTRLRLKDALSAFPFRVKSLGGVNEAMSTRGGVSLDEVNRQTMESRLVPGLFFCGEVLDIDGDTGGYNIQFALSSGFVAGRTSK